MSDVLDSLRRRIAIMYDSGANPTELGNIALEIILKRNSARDELEHNPTFDKKMEIERRIDALHELERAIVSLHALGGLKSYSENVFSITDYTKAKYQLFDKKTIS